MKITATASATAAVATIGRLLLQGLAGPACQQAMLAHTPQPAEVLQAWMLASIASVDQTEGWSTDRPAHAVHLQGAHA